MSPQNRSPVNLGGCFQTLAISALLVLIGAGLSWWGWTILQNARSSAGWPAANGQITASELDYSRDSQGDDSYTPRVSYTYSVNGFSYVNSTIKFGENSYGSERKAREILSRYPAGQAVSVYYDPADPTRSVLEAGVSAGSYAVLGIGLLFVVIGLLPGPLQLLKLISRKAG